jgi:acetylornithine deacetylase/succinyl-diaminopimelate desuccinylase-like protein
MATNDKVPPVVTLLSELIRLDTSNPPGNEEGAVQYLEAVLGKEGIKAEIFSPEPKRANILVRLKGRRAGSPVVLLSHLDVVPAHDEGWVVPPFSGAVQDGFIYGRGAIDMKSQVACQLLAFLGLVREGVTPERDMIFLATADEEMSGKLGVEYLLSKVEDLRHASFVLSEGGWIFEEGGGLHGQISVAEKKVCQFMVRARGTGGHGSMPHGDSANDKLVRAVEKIISARMPFRPTRIVTAYLNGLFKGRRVGKLRYSTLKEALRHEGFRAFVARDPMLNAFLRNTVALTMLRSGEKINVIPTESTACFDARILPDASHEAFLRQMRKIAGPGVEVLLEGRTDSAGSPYSASHFQALARAVRRIKGDIPVLPYLTTGATDLRHFRSLGIPAYGFFPVVLSKEEELRMHSLNERLSIANLEEGLRGTEEIVRALAL